ncbi:MAG: rod shape-determining protein MreC [Lachnospiraceae bacterium]|nr:rod shape-determining protein MreC [Lachnospiraceae bacterium]
MPVKKKNPIPIQYILFILTAICVLLLFFSYASGFSGGVLTEAAARIFVPMEKGITYVADGIKESVSERKSKEALQEENEALRLEVNSLREELSKDQLDQAELERLRNLMALKDTYSNYETTGAHVIARGQNNWFSSFTIDKGKADGIEVDMNVLSSKGLCGIVTETGDHFATVRTIVDDTSNVSGMVVTTQDILIVSGNLKVMNESQMINFSGLVDMEDAVKQGDPVVTSSISDKFVPGLLVGYLTEINEDQNRLTKSGKITPVSDFRHISEVLVILQKKETPKEGEVK